MTPGLLVWCLLLCHHLADFLAEHTLDFVLHRFIAGFTEMRPHKVSGLADFLHHRGRGVRLGAGEGHACGGRGKFVCHRRLLSVHQIFQPCQLVLRRSLAEILARKADRGAHLQQPVIDAGVGGVLGMLQVLEGQVRGDNQRLSAPIPAVNHVVDLFQTVLRPALHAEVIQNQQRGRGGRPGHRKAPERCKTIRAQGITV